jgi:hypothetical protein
VEARAVRPSWFVLPAFAVAAVLLFTPTAKAGLISTGPADVCSTTASQIFLPWGDYSNYVLIPGGSFEAGTRAWSLSGAAATVRGNEPFFVNSRSDSRAMVLLAGSSVTTPSMCFAPGDWHMRFFARNYGSQSSKLKVQVVVRSLLGVLSVLDGGTVSSTGTWQPSGQVQLTLSNLTALLGTRAVSFRFSVEGYGAWQIDDVYLDPWVST